MPINFPSSPAVGDRYTFNNQTWEWNGYGWESVGSLEIVIDGGGVV